MKGKDVDIGGDWIEVKGMFKYEHRFMESTGDFLPYSQVSDIFKHLYMWKKLEFLAEYIWKLNSTLEKFQKIIGCNS